MTWSDLELFLAVDRGGSLSEAGRALGVKQSTVSRRLTDLEDRLGSALFVRGHEGVLATPLGASWREPALRAEQGVLDAYRATAQRLDGVTGEVRIATLLSIADLLLAPELPALLEDHPGLRVSMVATGEVADLGRLEADIAVRLFRPTAGDLVARPLWTSTLVALATHDVKMRTRGRPLADWPWLGWTSPRLMPPGQAAWEEAQGIVPCATFLSPTTILSAARAGAGVALLSSELAHFFPELERLPIAGLPPIEVTFWLVAHRELRHTPRVAAVWAWLVAIGEQTKARSARFSALSS